MEIITPYLVHIAIGIGSTLLTAYLAKNHVNGTQYPLLSALFNAFGLMAATDPVVAPPTSTGHPLLDALRAVLNHPATTAPQALDLVKTIASTLPK